MPYFVFDHINIGPLRFYTWGFFVGAGFAAGYFLTLYRAKKNNIAPEKIAYLALAIFLGAVLGSRLLYFLQTPQDFFRDVSALWHLNQGGAMFYGGLLGALFFGWLYLKIAKENFWKMSDLVAPAAALGTGIGRIGCALINDHAGALTTLPWAIQWPDGFLRHPVAIYLSLFGFLLFAFLLWYEKKARFSGQLFLLFLLVSSAGRFFLDFTRESQGYLADKYFWQLSASQWISILIFFAALIIWQRHKTSVK